MLQRAAFLAAAAACGTTNAFRVAVVQHQVVTADTDDGTISANLDKYANATSQAAAAGAQLVVFPEFALGMDTGACISAQTPSAFCEPIPYDVGIAPCNVANASAATPIQAAASCLAQQYGLAVAINTCEDATSGATDVGDGDAVGNYNTELVYDAEGRMVARYRKSHPFYAKCFLTPAQPDLVTFTLPASAGDPGAGSLTIGVFTCFDIMFPSPGPVLAAQGVRHFVYSAAIPLVGSAAQSLWSYAHSAVLFGSNLQDGQSGVYSNGTRLTAAPPGGVDFVLFADL